MIRHFRKGSFNESSEALERGLREAVRSPFFEIQKMQLLQGPEQPDLLNSLIVINL